MKTIYLLGAPGSGKSSVADAVFSGFGDPFSFDKPISFLLYNEKTEPVIRLGGLREYFSGTDTLSMSVINKMNAFYSAIQTVKMANVVFGEGDRLAATRFMDMAKRHGDLHLFYLEVSEALSMHRRAARAIEHGLDPQNETWVSTRFTKHKELAHRYGAERLDASLPPNVLADEILAKANIVLK